MLDCLDGEDVDEYHIGYIFGKDLLIWKKNENEWELENKWIVRDYSFVKYIQNIVLDNPTDEIDKFSVK